MKINVLFFTFLFPIMMFGQELKVSEPIANFENSKMFGNEETGFVRVGQSKKDLIIQVLNVENVKINKSKTFEDFFKINTLVKIIDFSGQVYVLYSKEKGDKKFLYSSTIDMKTAELVDEKILVETEDDIKKDLNTGEFVVFIPTEYNLFMAELSKDKKELYVWYNKTGKDFDFSKMKTIDNRKYFLNFEMMVFTKDLELDWNKDVYFDKPIDDYIMSDFIFDAETDVFYFRLLSRAWGDAVGDVGDDLVKVSLDEKMPTLSHFELELGEKIFDFEFVRLANNNIIIHGLSWNESKSETSIFVLDFEDDLKEIDKVQVEFQAHPTFDADFWGKEIHFKGKVLETVPNNDSYTIVYEILYSKSPTSYGYDRYKKLKNNIIATISNEGLIDKIATIPIAGESYGVVKSNFCLTKNGENFNVAYIDRFFKYKTKDTKLDGDYLSAFTINSVGDYKYNIVSSLKDINDNVYYAFEKCVSTKNTINTIAYKKKKEDLIIQVKFDD